MDKRLPVEEHHCGVPVFQALFEGMGDPMLFDAAPTDNGTFMIEAWGINGKIKVWMGPHRDSDEARYQVHECLMETE